MAIKSLVKKALDKFVRECIVFESVPDFSDNTRAIFDEMARRGYDRKYRLIWYIDDYTAAYYRDGKPVYFKPGERSTIRKKLTNYQYYYRRKCTVICNRFIKKEGREVFFFLNHGSPIKCASEYYSPPEYVDWLLVQSKDFIPIISHNDHVPAEKLIPTGFARNDALFLTKVNLCRLFGVDDSNKVIAWYPTFRQHKYGLKTGSSHALPVIHDYEAANRLNETARANNVLIIVKPHFAQDLSLIRKTEFSNLRFIDNSFFDQNGISSYHFIGSTDALLTDYSSIYYDYTLCDKPIGVIWEDIDEYRQNPGFGVDLDYWLKGAEKLYNVDDLEQFVIRVARGDDLLKSERREISKVANASLKPDNASRAVDVIAEKAKL